MEAHLIQRSPEWIAWKKNKISGTDSSVIMQINPWKTPFALWEEKLSLREPQQMNSNMQRGVDLEPIALDLFNQITDSDFKPIVLEHPKEKWAIASLDGMNSKGEILEIKANGAKNHALALEGIIPEYYVCQIQHCLWISNAPVAYYFSYTPESQKIIEVKPDIEFIKSMIEKEREFFNQTMNFTPPPMTQKDYVKRDDRPWDIVAENLRYKLKQLEPYEKIKDEVEALKQELIKMSNGQSSIGGGLRLTKCVRKGAIDYNAIDMLKSIDLEIYRKKSTEYYRISENE